MGSEGTAGAPYEISIEGQTHPWGRDTISVAEIRELGGIPQDVDVVAVDLVDGGQRVLGEDAVHEIPPLQPGKPVVKRTNFERAS